MKLVNFNNVNRVEFDVLQLGIVTKMYSKLIGLGFANCKRDFNSVGDDCEYVFNFRSNDNVVVNAEISFDGKTDTVRAHFDVFGVTNGGDLGFLVAAITKQMNIVFDEIIKLGSKGFIETLPEAYRFMAADLTVGDLEAVM